MNPQENINRIKSLENDLYNTGIVFDIEYKPNYIVLHFSEPLDGLEGMRIMYSCTKTKYIAIETLLTRVRELQSKTSFFEDARKCQ